MAENKMRDDTGNRPAGSFFHEDETPDIPGSVAFLGVHAACLMVFWAGVSWIAVIVCVLTYYARAFGLTAGYHRCFSHRSCKTGRVFHFLLAPLGASAAQMGPLWWAAHHRHHHRHADTDQDIHSPVQRGFCWSHVGWILCRFCSNSLAHVFGRRRYTTKDTRRNNLLLALLTMGEGWHNNHHRYPFSERQGFYWWEIDPTHYLLSFLSLFRIVWDLNRLPAEAYATEERT